MDWDEVNDRRFGPEWFGWRSDSMNPNGILCPNYRDTFFNVSRRNGTRVPDHIGVFVDGACSGNGMPWAKGGYAVFFGENSAYNAWGSLPSNELHTNQRAELMSVIAALEQFHECHNEYEIGNLIIASDSAYLFDSITDYIWRWKMNGFINAKGTSVANQDLWVRLDNYCQFMLRELGLNIYFWQIDRSFNEDADEMARNAIPYSDDESN
jgi:ribonuclease HI